jgi:hypothetical protein
MSFNIILSYMPWPLPDIIRRMRWVRHIVCVGDENATKFWLKNMKGRGYLDDLGIGGRIIQMKRDLLTFQL